MPHNQSKSNHKQAGVSLLLSVLILAAVTAVAFSVATIVLIEIRSSADVLRTEPNLYATFGFTEEALYQYKRGWIPDDNDPDDFDVRDCMDPGEDNRGVCSINSVSLNLPGAQPLRFDNNPRVEYVAPASIVTIPLYEINEYIQEYEGINISVFPNETSEGIGVYYKKTSGAGIITYEDSNIDSNNVTLAELCADGFLDMIYPTDNYTYSNFATENVELFLVNCDTTQGISVAMVTDPLHTDPQHIGQPEGLPFTGKKVFRIVADYLGLTRTYQVEIPVP